MRVCHVCQDAKIEADTTLDDRPVHSWHLNELTRARSETRNPEREENEMPLIKHIDREKVKELHAQGLNPREIGERLGCSGSTAGYHKTQLGLSGKRPHRHNAKRMPKAVRNAHRQAATIEARLEDGDLEFTVALPNEFIDRVAAAVQARLLRKLAG